MKNYLLNLSVDQINHILSVLSKQPYSDVFELIAIIHQQCNTQEKEMSAPE